MSKQETWDEWEDCMGNSFRPGDLVAIATVSGRSPQLVVAEVIRINKTDAKGTPIVTRQFIKHDEPIMKTRTQKTYDYGTRGYKEEIVSYLEEGEYKQVPSATLTARPIESRFTRYGQSADGTNKPSTYTITANWVKIADGEG